MISTRAMGALRVAATLTHSLPNMRARIRLGDRTLLDVRTPDPRDAGSSPREATRTISPCGFRSAVGDAHRTQRAGGDPAFLDLRSDRDLAIDIATPPGGVALPGGIYRVPLQHRHLWAFAVTLDPVIAFEAGKDIVADVIPDGVVALGLRPDPATEVSLAYAETPATPGSEAHDAVLDLLEALLARWTTHELLATTTGAVTGGG